jgi:hypothetical protein
MGLCGIDGSMPAGNYTLIQTPVPGTQFEGWECYNVGGIFPVTIPVETVVSLSGPIDVTCVAVYTVVGAAPSPSPRPAGGPKLALISEYPFSYNGTSERASFL